MFARFFNTSIPVSRCNLRCHYCYIGHSGGSKKREESLHYSIEHIKKSLIPNRLGGVCMFNLCAAGETTLFKELLELTNALLELGHYVTIVTNNTLTEPIIKIATLPNRLTERLFIKCSFPYLELKKHGLLEIYFGNINIIRENNIAFSIELTANDESIPYIPEIKNICLERVGALCHIIESRDETNLEMSRLTKLSVNEHQAAWNEFQTPLFAYQQKNWGVPQNAFCYAGEYRLSLNIQTGDVYQCDGMKKLVNLFENPDVPVKYAAVGTNCIYGHCYAAHYQSCLCGCLSETNMPTYAEERDRICLDGTTWLTPLIRSVFSNRVSELHEPYSRVKKIFIDALMRNVYSACDLDDAQLSTIAKSIHDNFSFKGYKKAAIYGFGKLGIWLATLMRKAGIDIAYVIDKRASEINCPYPILAPWDNLPEADVIIVSVYSEFSAVAPILHGKTEIPVMSVITLADET